EYPCPAAGSASATRSPPTSGRSGFGRTATRRRTAKPSPRPAGALSGRAARRPLGSCVCSAGAAFRVPLRRPHAGRTPGWGRQQPPSSRGVSSGRILGGPSRPPAPPLMSEHRSSIRASLWGFAVGGATGFALGLLLAPDEGQQVRQRLAYLLDRWSNQVARVAGDLLAESDPSAARQSADAVVAEARHQAEQLLSEAEALMREARSRRSGGDGASPLRRAS